MRYAIAFVEHLVHHSQLCVIHFLVCSKNANMKSVFFCSFFLWVVHAEGILLHTNIGKFLDNIHQQVQKHTLKVPANETIDRLFLEQTFQGFRNIIDDPLVIMDQKLDYEMTDVLKLHGYVRNLQVKHLKNLTLHHVNITKDNMYSEFVIRVPLLEIAGQYNSSCYLKEYDFDVYGNGTFQWIINDFQIRVNFTLSKMKTGYLQLDRMDWDQSIGNSKFEIKNLLNDETISTVVSDVLTVIIPPLHNYFKPAINEFTVRLVMLYSEIIFSNIKAKEFLGVLYAFREKARSDNQL